MIKHLGSIVFFLNVVTALQLHATGNSAVQTQMAVSAYFTSKQILPFVFVHQIYCSASKENGPCIPGLVRFLGSQCFPAL